MTKQAKEWIELQKQIEAKASARQYGFKQKSVEDPLQNMSDSNQPNLWDAAMYDWDGVPLPSGNKDKPSTGCNHEWKTYHGFNTTDEYCVKCNEIKK